MEHSIEFTDEAAAARNVPPDVTIHEPALVPSALLLSGTTVDPIAKIKGNFGFTQKVGIETPNGLVGVTELIEGLALYAAQVVTHVKG